MESFWKSVLREFLRSKSGRVGIVLILIIVILTSYSLIYLPSSTYSTWSNPAAWTTYPIAAPPVWTIDLGAKLSPSITTNLEQWQVSYTSAGSTNLYEYTSNFNFDWTGVLPPQNVIFVPVYVGNVISSTISWTKPGQNPVQISIQQVQSGTQYDANSAGFKQAASQIVASETGQFLSSPSKADVMAALFNENSAKILSGPVAEGTYNVQIQLVSTAPLNISKTSSFYVLGTAYGSMGTDYLGRPVSLGILAGLPNALELGVVTSIVAVVAGVVFGGISGYLGRRKDAMMQWVTLVFLALPALPFLVAISYTTTISVIEEALLIAFLSWPFFAIIARTVALSIKSQTYIEADKAMGVSAIRSFFTHFMPRLIPVSIAYTVLGIPASLILAETLGFLGIQPPNLVTWGAILDDAFANQAALYGWWWWVAFPGIMIIFASIPFVLIGFALERVIAPRVSSK